MNDRTSTMPAHGATIHIGHEELATRQHFETLSICNDVASGLLFLVGSVLFFSDATMTIGTWLFVFGSVLMLIRPTIRLTRRIALARYHGGDRRGAYESSMDF